MSSPQALLLAAGQGRRAGGPKAWKMHEGRALLERQLEFLTARFCPARVAISIQPDWTSRCAALCPGAAWVPVDPEAAPLASLQALIRRLGARWSFLHHVDMPVWESALFNALEAAIPEAERRGADAILPIWKKRRGHPVLLSPRASESVLQLDARTDRLDLWLRARDVLTVQGTACILENWNF